nr:cysteine-rich KTR domain-containing protein [Streptococcus ruminantium]
MTSGLLYPICKSKTRIEPQENTQINIFSLYCIGLN